MGKFGYIGARPTQSSSSSSGVFSVNDVANALDQEAYIHYNKLMFLHLVIAGGGGGAGGGQANQSVVGGAGG